ncbi:MBL fold metallo-hydrolase [Aquimarina algiphila]|uniref:MBL fold metallo-hydrolase n=1 Tax=Aquimarina algiphila TaxID=2047982 RepID=UPI00232C3B09|nr:MBL fold metallo-hydrolase [Aquimarina algiphila]
MKFNLLKYCALAFALSVVSCNDDNNDATEGGSNSIPLSQVVNALGGTAVINNITTMKYTVEGQTNEYEEEEPNVSNPINTSNYVRTVSTELNTRKVRYDFSSLNIKFPFPFQVDNSTTIINNQKGSYSGNSGFGSHFFGATAALPLFSSRIEAYLKIQKMSNPIELLKQVISTNDLSSLTSSNFTIPTGIDGLNIELVIDQNISLPKSAQVTEADFINGDVVFEVNYEDWKTVGETMFPSKLTHTFNGEIIKVEELSNIEMNPAFTEVTFTPENTDGEYIVEQGEFGIYSSWWYERFNALGFVNSFDQPLNNGAVTTPTGPNVADQTIGPNVKIIGRADVGSWSVAVKTSTGVVVVEPPLNPRWTRSIINTVKNDAFPDENIEGVIVTHTHFDHFGGVRELAHESGKVYVGEEGVALTERVLTNHSSLLPDALAVNPISVEVEGVSDVTTLDGGTIQIHLLKTESLGLNSHSENIVAVYVPESESFIVSDLFNAGGFVAVAAGFGATNFNEESRSIIAERATYLLDYITEKELVVSNVIAIHNGVATLADLQLMANL